MDFTVLLTKTIPIYKLHRVKAVTGQFRQMEVLVLVAVGLQVAVSIAPLTMMINQISYMPKQLLVTYGVGK